MYGFFKAVVRFLIPKSVVFRMEPSFRKVSGLFYRGSRFHCPVCETNLSRFVILPNHDKLCPACGSISRNRRLWTILQTSYLQENTDLLDFSPSRNLYRKLKKVKSIHYISSDLSGDFIAEKKYDITAIECGPNTYDLILCFHILEHIEDDRKAMAELFRVLKSGGTCLIQTPFKEGNCYENPAVKTPEERRKEFGQEDHVRIYSVEELQKRLQEAGLRVKQLHYEEDSDNRFGFSEKEVILEASK